MKRGVKPRTCLYPVPAVLISCGQVGGEANLITIAWTGTVASMPPQVGISIRRERYSYGIIEEKREFVINLPTVEMIEALDYCGVNSGRDVDKFKETGLNPLKGEKVDTPVVEESPLNLECVVQEILPLKSHDLFIGEVVHIQVNEELLNEKDSIDFNAFKAITYMGRDYWSLGEVLGSFGLSKS